MILAHCLTRPVALPALGLLLALVCTLAAADAPPAAPAMRALRVADGAITVDGHLDDWPPFATFAPYAQSVTRLEGHANPDMTQGARGLWQNDDDLSFHVSTAVDGAHFYVAATVHDQVLINDANPDWPWAGDEFEVFIDANPPAQRHLDHHNENVAQFIFVPVQLWAGQAGTFNWRADKYPGVTAASRLTPTGYTIEVAIPLDVVPNWQEHHDLADIGFDVQVGDADTPGLPGHDAGPKLSLALLRPFPHFKSAANLATLAIDAAPKPETAVGGIPSGTAALPGYDAAQALLDRAATTPADEPALAAAASAALVQPDLARKAALFLFARRPALATDLAAIAAMAKVLAEPAPTTPAAALSDARPYAMMALAQRHQLPAADVLAKYGTSDDLILRHTALWALGLNGDKTVLPELLKVYPTSTLRTQEILAVTLARLGDPTAVPLLQQHAKSDKGQIYGDLCTALLKQLGVAAE